MNKSVFETLNAAGMLSDKSLKNIQKQTNSTLFSIHWELRTLLYLGVMMLSTGLGILVYKNIETISHQAVLTLIGLLTIGCFTWCYKNKLPFCPKKVESPNSLFDYILLLGTLSFLSFVGYLQFQYDVFGTRYGLATFIPMLFLFGTAYYFDHLGILTMGIASLAIWMGVTITPKALLERGNFSSERAIFTYLFLGFFLMTLGYFSRRYDFKKHFSFSYHNYGVHLSFLALISGYFFYNYVSSLIWLILFGITAWFIYTNALNQKSFYFLMITAIYTYMMLGGFVNRSLLLTKTDESLYFGFLYLIGSGIWLVVILMKLNKNLQAS